MTKWDIPWEGNTENQENHYSPSKIITFTEKSLPFLENQKNHPGVSEVQFSKQQSHTSKLLQMRQISVFIVENNSQKLLNNIVECTYRSCG